ncbi:hypothetical protein TTHERM_00217170 (macronuclear) [Tetrahymena thermophila SB210]|uniref:Uncharacterized protein n=1 Tax=Tetrahymena thermophila (strain SB210) TaxID=312017 RepID=I7M2E6_TETTS|nr:hypothetical protein TTHERM_00217170 [Tetrahymena thermophila SB210]EAS00243.2 hypothetical protein TTHERM_00217170 [Tetrahymena thermophila SB210]|eukprot:XP_001020488.2 hypothetical protein TTHERM_00217170 [Tetrahymena thermophila SB210]
MEQQQISSNDIQQIINYLKSNLCDFIFNQLGPDQNSIVNLQSQLIEQRLLNFREGQKQLLNTFIKKYIALTNCYTISRSRFKQILFLNGSSNQNNLGFDLLKFDPQLKQIISKIPNKYGQIDREVLDKIDYYQTEYSKQNLMAFEDDIQQSNQQKFKKNIFKSQQEDDMHQKLNRSSSFIDYRNSNSFQKDFKNYVKSRSKKNSSVFEDQIYQKDKTPSNQQQSQRYTRSYSQINLQRKKQNSSIQQSEESGSQFKHKFSLISGDDQQKSPYLKKHGKQNEDIQNHNIRNNLKQNHLLEVKTPYLNPKNNSQQNDENEIVNQLLSDSSFDLNAQKILTESSSQNHKYFISKKNQENQTNPQMALSKSKSQNLLNDNKQVRLQQDNPNKKIYQKNNLISENDYDSQEDILRSVQISYNNYAKYKGDPQLQKINLQSSPLKERKSLYNEKKSNQLSQKNTENSNLQKQAIKQSQITPIDTSIKHQIIQPQTYRYLAQSRSKEKLTKSNTQNRYIDDDELYTDSSPIYIVNQNYEKRQNLQPYFNEIIMTHSRRQNSTGKNYEIQVKYRVKKDFIDQCQQQNVPIKEALQRRIDYIQKDGSLAVFEKPTDETCIQSFKHTQLNKSLSPKKKQDLENILQNIENYEESKRSSINNNTYNNFNKIDNRSQYNFEKNLTLSPLPDKNLQAQTIQMNDFFTINQCLSNQDLTENKSFSQQSSVTNRSSALNQIDKNCLSEPQIDTNKSSPEPKKKSSHKYFQKHQSRKNQSSSSLNIPTDLNITQSPQQSAFDKSIKKLSIQSKSQLNQYDKQIKIQSQEQLIEELFQKEDFIGLSAQNSERKQHQIPQIQITDNSQNSFRNPIFYKPSEFYIKQLNQLK